MSWLKKNTFLFLLLSLTLGLAPFNPPHIWGKLVWISGGGAFSGENTMKLADWGDGLFHGAPWLLLLLSLAAHLVKKKEKTVG